MRPHFVWISMPNSSNLWNECRSISPAAWESQNCWSGNKMIWFIQGTHHQLCVNDSDLTVTSLESWFEFGEWSQYGLSSGWWKMILCANMPRVPRAWFMFPPEPVRSWVDAWRMRLPGRAHRAHSSGTRVEEEEALVILPDKHDMMYGYTWRVFSPIINGWDLLLYPYIIDWSVSRNIAARLCTCFLLVVGKISRIHFWRGRSSIDPYTYTLNIECCSLPV